MKLLLKNPCIITPRLMAGVRVGDAWISIEYGERSDRQYYTYHIDTPTWEHEGSDLSDPGYGLQSALECLLAFLEASAESLSYSQRTGTEYDGTFSRGIAEWASQYSDEIGSLRIELEETKNLIKEVK